MPLSTPKFLSPSGLVRRFLTSQAGENRRAAARTANKIWKSTELLGKHPMAGREGRVAGTRELVIRGTPFIVAYRVERNEVHVLAVMHAARKWPDEF